MFQKIAAMEIRWPVQQLFFFADILCTNIKTHIIIIINININTKLLRRLYLFEILPTLSTVKTSMW